MRATSIASAVIAGALAVAPAAAAMEVGASDPAVFQPRQSYGPEWENRWYGRAAQVGATRVRLWAPVEPDERQWADRAVAAARAHGFRVLMTIHPVGGFYLPARAFDLGAYLRLVRDTVRRYPDVDEFSIWNEPDLTIKWTPQSRTVYWHFRTNWQQRRKTYRRVRWARVKGGRYVKLRSLRRRVRFWHVERAGRARWHGRIRRAYRVRLFPSQVAEPLIVSHPMAPGVYYRQIFRAAYMTAKAARPSAKILAGETSPHAWVTGFVDDFLCNAPTEGDCAGLRADGFATHPYSWVSPGDVAHACQMRYVIARRLNTDLYFTEFGYPTDGFRGMDESYGAAHARADEAAAARCGVKLFVWYGWNGNPAQGWVWHGVSMFRADDSPRPVYQALTQPPAP